MKQDDFPGVDFDACVDLPDSLSNLEALQWIEEMLRHPVNSFGGWARYLHKDPSRIDPELAESLNNLSIQLKCVHTKLKIYVRKQTESN